MIGGIRSAVQWKKRRAFRACEATKTRLNAYHSGGLFRVITPLGTTDPDQAPDCAVLPQHECGLFGVFGHPNAAVLSYYGLFALQHRGQESAGIVTSNGPG